MRSRLNAPSRQAIGALLATLITAVDTVMLYLLRDILSTPVIALLFLLPVLVASSLWGLGPGVVAAIFAFLSFNYLFIAPYYTLAVHQTQDLLALVVFFGVAILISQLMGRIQSGLADTQSHLQEVTRLYEFSASLASLWQAEEVAQRLAVDLRHALNAESVRVIVQSDLMNESFAVTMPKGADVYGDWPNAFTIPLTTNRDHFGEIKALRARGFSASEQQILRAFASSGALALERAVLEKHETRARALEESDHFKSALLASISHDLRTPLVTIKAAAASLRSGDVDWDKPARKDLLAALDEETDRLNELVSDLLNMSRIDAGALRLQHQWHVLADIVDATVSSMKPRLGNRPLEIDVSEDLPMIWVDHKLIERVFVNLIENSLKYSPSETPIKVNAYARGENAIVVEIINAGPPVPEEFIESIFERFHRVTDADRIPGTGLGLSICKGIIEAHQGRIWAENLGNGFAFKFTLPTASGQDKA